MANRLDYNTLNWVKPELDDTLNQARIALEAYVEGGDAAALERCTAMLHQAWGALSVLDLRGAAALVEEMERAVGALAAGAEAAGDALMRALLSLPDYLGGIQQGRGDIAVVLGPLVNDLRAVRDEAPLPEHAFFDPELHALPTGERPELPLARDLPPGAQALARQLRPHYHAALAAVLRKIDVRRNLQKLAIIADHMDRAVERAPLKQMFWIFAALAKALADEPEATALPAPLFGQIERRLKLIAEGGEGSGDDAALQSLARALLFRLAKTHSGAAQVAEVREAFHLPDADELARAQASLTGAGAQLFSTVAAVLKESLSRVKDSLDVFVRGTDRPVAELAPLGGELTQIGDALDVLGRESLSARVREQAASLDQAVASGQRPDVPYLMDVAGALLAVEAALDQPAEAHLRQGHGVQRDLLVAVISEAKTDLARAKEAVVYYLSAPHDASPVKAVPDLLGGVTGSLLMLDEGAAAGLLDACRRYIRDRLLGGNAPPPGPELDALADAVASIEYYLEALGEGWADPDSILDVARASVEGLGYPALDLGSDALGFMSDVAPNGEAADAAGEDEEPDVGAPAAVAQAPAESAPAAPAPQRGTPAVAVPTEELDLEIAEIFCEEADEELENIGRLLAIWRDNPQDMATLRDLRRCFHTLKGSGRLVGATGVGEFAWAFENMLNRVTDGTLAVHPVMYELIEAAQAQLPGLLAVFSNGAAPPDGTDALIARAEAAARGEFPADEVGAEGETTDPGAHLDFEVDTTSSAGEDIAIEADAVAGSEVPGEALEMVETGGGFAELDLDELDDAPVPADAEVAAAISSAATEAADAVDSDSSEDALELVGGFDSVESDLPTLEGLELEESDDTAATADEEALQALAMSGDARLSLDGFVLDEQGPTVDPVLLDIYSKESAGHLEDLRAFISAARSLGGAAVTDALVRALHTLHGSSRTAEIEPAAELSGQLERYAKIAQAHRAPVDTDALDLLQDSVDFISDTVSLLGVPGASLPDRGPLMQRVERAILRLKAPALPVVTAETGTEYDPELLEVFLEEGAEILDRAEGLLHQWRRAPDELEVVEGLQRELHTLKGGARMVGATPIGDLSHVLESLLAALADRRMPGSMELIDLAQACQDRLAHQIDQLRRGEAVSDGSELVAAVEEALRAQDIAPPEDPDADDETGSMWTQAPEVDAGVDAPEIPAPPPSDLADAPAVASAVDEPPDNRRDRTRVQHEQVRVRADLLDQLVNNAGEVSIYRARLEQQANASRGALDELDETIERLRGQLRRFEIETEAQIQSRYEETANYQDFDPLEFDRFTEMQQVSRGMLETLNDLDSLRGTLVGLTRETETLLLQQSRVNTELQEKLMRTRMVPFGTQASRLRRIVRQTCAEVGKQAELQLPGGGGELDRAVLDRMMAPIEHMLRNAIAHGIEAPQERAAVGKPESGSIAIRLAREGSEVVLELLDDGAGFDLDAIRAKALERGLMVEGAELTQEDIMQFVLESGFSTAQDISQVSGRGVGMDVVNSEIKQLGGTLQIESKRGQGTRFMVRLPLTLSVTRALMVNVGEEQFAIPLLGIESIVRVSHEELEAFLNDPTRSYEWLGQDYRFMHLGNLIGFERGPAGDERTKLPLLLVRSGEHRAALLVDSLIGSRETVVKSVGPQLSTLRGISGATILGDGSVVLILDLAVLIRHGLSTTRSEVVAVHQERKVTVMVVDDSITVRRVTARLLERHNMEVVTAKDGVEALAMLAESVPDVMLLDVEMPRMDGYELASHMRNQQHLSGVPIVMITSRTGDKHRERAMSLGVDRYMGKPYQEGELLDTISELLREGRVAPGALAGR